MLTITVRDLQFRRRQFGIAVVGAALVFALTLLLTGMSAGFTSEARDSVASTGARTWLVPEGVSGPFTALPVVDPAAGQAVGADPLVITPSTITDLDGAHLKGVNLIGHRLGGLGAPAAWRGRAPQHPGEAMMDSSLGVRVGRTVLLSGRRFRVTGTVRNKTYLAGVPVVYVLLDDGQQIAYGGRPLATALITRDRVTTPPPGLRALSNDDVVRDLTRPTAGARQTIASTRAFMWMVAVVIIGAVTYLSALERVRDFAVLKATGARPRTLLLSIAAEAVLAALLAAGLAVVLSRLLLPAFALRITITAAAYLVLPVIAATAGVLASLAAIRRAVRVDPALAFG